jgi:hypothetical protein
MGGYSPPRLVRYLHRLLIIFQNLSTIRDLHTLIITDYFQIFPNIGNFRQDHTIFTLIVAVK